MLDICSFEINPAVVNFYFFQAVGDGGSATGSVYRRSYDSGAFRWRQPILQIPTALTVPDEGKAWLTETQRAKFKAAVQKTRPAEASGKLLRAQKIFITKCGIFANGYADGIDARTGQDFNVEMIHLHGSAEGIFQTVAEKITNARGPHGNRGSDLSGHQNGGHPKGNLPRIPQIGHDQKSGRLRPKCVGREVLKNSAGAIFPLVMESDSHDELLMDGVKHSMPASARGKMHKGIEDADQPLPESAVARVIGASGVDGPIDKKWMTHDGVAVDKSPVTAVLAVVAIISHGEISSRRDDHFIVLNIFAKLGPPLVDDV